MAREIRTRWKISGTLTAETPIHVGGIGGDADTDLALAVNGQSNYYIPGTSLAGALRGWMGRSLDETNINGLWGYQQQDKGHASFVVVEDAQIRLPKDMTIEIREGVGIDRHTGAAAEGFKYSRAILPKGATLPLKITLDIDKKQNQNPENLWQLLCALEAGDIRIGAAKTRGLGRVKLDNIAIHRQDLSNPEGLFSTLLNNGAYEKWEDVRPNNYQPPNQLTLDIAWKPRDPVMVKAEGDGIAVDMLPLVSQVNSGVRFVIPGSSIKGVLRAHAERIVRTLLEINITPNEKDEPKFNEQIRLSTSNKTVELIDVIFGSAEKSKGKNSEGKMGTLFIDDCYATIPMTSDNWLAVENAAKSKNEEFKDFQKTLKTALEIPEDRDENPFQILQPAMHVAVDRWTGGAADGMLYSVLEPIGVNWEAIGIHLDLERLKKYEEGHVQPAIALLLLVLRDFANRKIPIGYGTNRGMGTVQVNEVTLTSSQIDGLEGIEGEHKVADVPDKVNLLGNLLDDKLLETLTKTWVEWIKASGKEVSQ